jgi:hypothetical protein
MSTAINLIRQATGPLGDFKLPVCISLITSHGIFLSDEDVDVILSRYKEHAKFWNFGEEAITRELNSLSVVAHRDSYSIVQRFKTIDRGLWRQYLEPVYQVLPHQTLQHEIMILDKSYLIDIESQRTRTVMRITGIPDRLLTEPDLSNLKKLAHCLASHFQVWLDMPGVLEEYVRIFARAVVQDQRGEGAFSPIPVADLRLAIDECVARLGGSYRPS